MKFFAHQHTPPSRWKGIRRAIFAILYLAFLGLFISMTVQSPPRDATGWLLVALIVMGQGIGLVVTAMGYIADRRHAQRFAQWQREMEADGRVSAVTSRAGH